MTFIKLFYKCLPCFLFFLIWDGRTSRSVDPAPWPFPHVLSKELYTSESAPTAMVLPMHSSLPKCSSSPSPWEPESGKRSYISDPIWIKIKVVKFGIQDCDFIFVFCTIYANLLLLIPDPEREAFEEGPPPTLRIMRYESNLNQTTQQILNMMSVILVIWVFK